MTELTPQAQTLLEKRYLHPGEKTWEDVARRVAHTMANDPEEEDRFFQIINDRLFIPNSPTLMNAGIKNGQYSACFLLPVGDSIDEIFDAVKWAAKTHQSGGGTGFNFSQLRPEGSLVKGSNGQSSGPISFMRVFDEATQQMKQGGRRKGANIGLLTIEHPDIVKFIKCKDQEGQFSNFNISVAVTDNFMRNLAEQPDCVFVTYFKGQKYLISKADNSPITSHVFMEGHQSPPVYSIREVWDLLVNQAWKTADPGLIFWDKITEKDQSIHGVNPCGELPLEPFGACNLGSIDVSKFSVDIGDYDWSYLSNTVITAVDFLNRVIDKNTFPIPQITETVQRSRRIGLGIMGFADLLIKECVRYGSQDSYKIADELMKHINTIAREYSNETGYNNKTVTCIAPTGSISILAGCSSGIEPNFSWRTKHKRKDFDDEYTLHPLAEPYISQDRPLEDYFVKASEVSPENHVKMLSVFQKHVESAVSKTVNLPNNATVKDIDEVYKLAHALGCKGITVYRDGCKQDQVLTDVDKVDKIEAEVEVDDDGVFDMDTLMEHLGLDEPRPDVLDGFVFKIQLDLDGNVENVYIPVGMLDGRPYELFVVGNLRAVGPVFAQFIDSLTRMTSLAMRWGVPLDQIAAQLEKTPEGHMYSVPHKVAQILRSFIVPDDDEVDGPVCPECGEPARFESGCMSCECCGWSRCS